MRCVSADGDFALGHLLLLALPAHVLLGLRGPQLQVGLRAEVGPDPAVRAVSPPPALRRAVGLHVLDPQGLGVQSLLLGVGLQVLDQAQQHPGRLLRPAAQSLLELLSLRSAADAPVVAQVGNAALVGDHVLEVGLGLREGEALDGPGSVVGVFVVDPELTGAGLDRLVRVRRLPRVLLHHFNNYSDVLQGSAGGWARLDRHLLRSPPPPRCSVCRPDSWTPSVQQQPEDDSKSYLVIRYGDDRPETKREVARLVKRVKEEAASQNAVNKIFVVEDASVSKVRLSLKIPQLAKELSLPKNLPSKWMLGKLANLTDSVDQQALRSAASSVLNGWDRSLFLLNGGTEVKEFERIAAELLVGGLAREEDKFLVADSPLLGLQEGLYMVRAKALAQGRPQVVRAQTVQAGMFARIERGSIAEKACPEVHVLSSLEDQEFVMRRMLRCAEIRKRGTLSIQQDLTAPLFAEVEKLMPRLGQWEVLLARPGVGRMPHLAEGNPRVTVFDLKAETKAPINLTKETTPHYAKCSLNLQTLECTPYRAQFYRSKQRKASADQLRERVKAGRVMFKTAGEGVRAWDEEVLVVHPQEVEVVEGTYVWDGEKLQRK